MLEPSGDQWCSRYPTSKAVDDLAEPFRANVGDFLHVLKLGGAEVSIQATRRPAERAYLMHWAWGLVHGFPSNMCLKGMSPNVAIRPDQIPGMAGIAIDWGHDGDDLAALKAAAEMVSRYQIAYAPSLTSLHIRGEAIDMAIRFAQTGTLVAKDGAVFTVPAGSTGDRHRGIQQVGASYGVKKLITDAPHWSSSGK